MVNRASQKLAKWYFEPFQIIQRVFPVAYKLELPSHNRIHPMFHISILKLCHNLSHAVSVSLPPEAPDDRLSLVPAQILDYRSIKLNI